MRQRKRASQDGPPGGPRRFDQKNAVYGRFLPTEVNDWWLKPVQLHKGDLATVVRA